MSAKITRGSNSRSKPRSRQSGKGNTRRASPAVQDSLPLPPETVRKVSSFLFGALLVGLLLAVLVAFRLPQFAGVTIGEAVGQAGFTLRHIEPKGLNRLNAMQVYGVAQDQLNRPMPLLDLEGTRQRLRGFGWVQDARVSRRFPDTMVVDIVERKPAAIWQYNQQLTLIDRDGVVLEPVKLEAMPDLPLVIGPAANQHASELDRLLAAAPELRQIVEGATWIGGRRWDLRFHSGETLALPEGEEAAARALARFSEKDRKSQLLGRGFVRFDMRVPGKLIVRVSREPGSIVPDVPDVPPPPSQGEPPTSQTI